MKKRLCSLMFAVAAVAACSESSQPTGVIPAPLDANHAVLAQLTCRVDVAASTMSCAPAGPAASEGRSSDLIFGGQNVYVKVTSTNVVTTPTVSVTADVTLKNLTGQPWNTGDSTTVDTAGVKVFFQNLPTNGVVISNPTSTQTFTAPNQPYFKYSGALLGANGILTPGETSGAINWNFTLNGATTFTFGVLIVAKMPDESGPLLFAYDTLSQTLGIEFMRAVWGTSPSDVWVGDPNGGPTALQHWDGASWTASSAGYCSSGGAKCTTWGLWGASSSDVWAVGDEILHNTGSGWAFALTPTYPLHAVWGTSTSNIYAAGDSGDVYQYNGTSWAALSKATTGFAKQNITSIWGSGASDVYFGTSDASTTGGLGIRRFNGTSWTTVSAGINSVRALWGSSATDIWAGGDSGLLRHFNGATWSTISVGFGTTLSDAIFGISGSSPTNVFVSEANGNLWHFNGTNWFRFAPPSGVGLFGVWSSGQNVFAAGFANVGGPSPFAPLVIRGKH